MLWYLETGAKGVFFITQVTSDHLPKFYKESYVSVIIFQLEMK